MSQLYELQDNKHLYIHKFNIWDTNNDVYAFMILPIKEPINNFSKFKKYESIINDLYGNIYGFPFYDNNNEVFFSNDSPIGVEVNIITFAGKEFFFGEEESGDISDEVVKLF